MIGKNNPFNIRYSHRNQWLGLDKDLPVTKGFCNFIDSSYGIRAACFLLMRSYRMRGVNTISEIIKRFAPNSENDTERYIKFVSRRSGIGSCMIINSVHFYAIILYAMSVFEGNPVSYDDIFQVIYKFKIKLYEK